MATIRPILSLLSIFCLVSFVNALNKPWMTKLIVGNRRFELTIKPGGTVTLEEGENKQLSFHLMSTDDLHDHDDDGVHSLDKNSDVLFEFGIGVPEYQRHVAEIETGRIHFITHGTNGSVSYEGQFSVKGLFLGRTALIYTYSNLPGSKFSTRQNATSNTTQKIFDTDVGNYSIMAEQEYELVVIRSDSHWDHVFVGCVMLMVIISNIGMGCKIDLNVVKEVLGRPVAPAIGLFSQYIIMPLISFGLVMALGIYGGQALGFFAMGCAPGGGLSNMYTLLLDGDVSLSVTMTFISTMLALAVVPAWMLSLGSTILGIHNTQIKIPFMNIFYSLIGMILPICIGLLIQRFRPNWAKCFIKILRPLFIFFIIFMLTFGFWVNLYLLKLFTAKLILAGCLLPYLGFLLGGVLATIFKQNFQRVITIAIETGIQNSGVPILLMKFTLPQPEADLSIISPVTVSTFTPLPLLTAVLAYEIYKRCFKTTKNFLPVPNVTSGPVTNGDDNGNQTINETKHGQIV